MGYHNVIYKKVTDCRWIRPKWFLTEPIITSGEKVVYLLNRITATGFNYVRMQVKGAYTVDWGDGNVIDYTDDQLIEYNIDYSGVSNTISGSTDKIHWIKVTPQSGDITKFIINAFKTTTSDVGAAANQGILEILVGSLNITGSYVFYLAQMNSLKHISFVNDFSISYNLTNHFASNYSLEKIDGVFASPIYNSGAFNSCYSLWDVQDFEFVCTGSVTAQGAFYATSVIEWNLPNFKYNQGRSLFSGSQKLEKITTDLSACTGMYQYAFNSYNLSEMVISAGDGSLVTNMYQAFDGCNFTETPALNLNSCTDARFMFDDNRNLKKSNLSNIKTSIGFNNCNLDHNAIYDIFNSQLQTVVSATIDLRLNPDISNLPAATIAIATGKGWTVQII